MTPEPWIIEELEDGAEPGLRLPLYVPRDREPNGERSDAGPVRGVHIVDISPRDEAVISL